MELLNGNPGSRPGSDSEVPSVGACEPDAGWRLWQAPDWLYPSTSLPALEAVQAAKAQSLRASEQLDRGLRAAFWTQSRCISNRAVILAVAAALPDVDAQLLEDALELGTARAALARHTRESRSDAVVCSPHIFLPDGSDHANPGVDVAWQGDWGVGYPLITRDDPTVYDALVRLAAA